jgi:hypothetical protein
MTDALSAGMLLDHQKRLEQLEKEMHGTALWIRDFAETIHEMQTNMNSLAGMLVALRCTISGATDDLITTMDKIREQEKKDEENDTTTTTTTTTTHAKGRWDPNAFPETLTSSKDKDGEPSDWQEATCSFGE